MRAERCGAVVLALMLLLGGCERDPGTGNQNNNSTDSCGNGVIDPGEQCDGTELVGVTCVSLGFTGGTLACGGDCHRNVSGCIIPEGCGNGVLDPGEECDGVNLGGQDCAGLGLEGGSLGCSLACRFETAGCDAIGVCGDGVATPPGEACDGSDLAGQSCLALGYGGGTLACNGVCQLDLTGCVSPPICGDDQLDPGEACDGAQLGGASCVSLGYDGGTLDCSAVCTYDVTGCSVSGCGDGVITLGEECDGSNFGGVTCENLGYDGGQLACTGNCLLDTSGCTEVVEVCSPFQSASCGSSISSTTVGGPTNLLSYPCASNPDSGPEAYFLFTNNGASPMVVVDLVGAGGANLDLIVVGVGGGDCDVAGSCQGASQIAGGTESLTIAALPGSQYYVIVDGANGDAGAFTLTFTCM